ncbi:MAG: CHAT domain-containing protein, partial [Acidobacteriota bacterium]
GEAAFADPTVRKRAVELVREWNDQLDRSGAVLPLLINDAWHDFRHDLPRQSVRREFLADLATPAAEVLATVFRVLGGRKRPRLYISHAPEDADVSDAAAQRIAEISKTHAAVTKIFGDAYLLTGDPLKSQLESEARYGVLVAVRSDRSSALAWCHRELLRAKKQRWPTLVVEVLKRGEDRSFPYAGNTPTVPWNHASKAAGDQAMSVALRAMAEAVAWQHHQLVAERIIEAASLPKHNVETFPRSPELLDVAALQQKHPGTVLALHPDPELSPHEVKVLHEIHPRLRLVTPASSFRGHLGRGLGSPLAGWKIALSFADSPDVDGLFGTTAQHIGDVVGLLGRSIFCAGGEIAYGSDFRRNSFGQFLMDLIAAYNETASQPADLLHCFLSADLDLGAAEGLPFTAYDMAEPTSKTMAPLPTPIVPPPPPGQTTAAARALCLSDMRRVMEPAVQARILIGGKRRPRRASDGSDPAGYDGLFVGLVEEAWRSLTLDGGPNPLYVLGGYGGGAQLVADLFGEGPMPAELIDENHAGNAHYQAIKKKILKSRSYPALKLPGSLSKLSERVREEGRKNLRSDESAVEWNGRTRAENLRLMRSRDPLQITSLVLKGLLYRARQKAKGRVYIHLIQDHLVRAQDLELVVVPTYADIPSDEGQQAIDRATGGALSEAQRNSDLPIPSRTQAMDADYVWAANLGDLHEASGQAVQQASAAARNLAQAVNRSNFKAIGLTAFDGLRSELLEKVVVDGMLPQLLELKDVHISWFEPIQERFEILKRVLGTSGAAFTSETRPVESLSLPQGPSTPMTHLVLRRGQGGGSDEVCLLLPDGNVLAPTEETSLKPFLQLQSTAEDHEQNHRLSADQLQEVGSHLRAALFPGAASAVLDRIAGSQLVISHDPELASIPFEALRFGNGTGAESRPAAHRGLSRRLRLSGTHSGRWLYPARYGHGPRLRVLLVAVTAGSDIQKGIAKELDEVYESLSQLRGSVSVKVLAGHRATPRNVEMKLTQGGYDLFHFIGHGFFQSNPSMSGLWLANDQYLDFEDLRKVSRRTRVVILNTCESGRVVMPNREPGDENLSYRKPETFAGKILETGCAAFVGTRWRVHDKAAVAFAKTLYETLAGGDTLARGVTAGRRTLYEKGSEDWANYQLYGDGLLRLT